MERVSDGREGGPPRRGARTRISGRLAAVLLAAVLGAGCAVFGGGQTADEPARHVTIWVQNLNWSAVHVRVRGSGASHRSLGLIASQDTARFEVPISSLGPRHELQLAADPVSEGQAFITEPIFFKPGYRIEWTVRQPLYQSSVMVR